MNDQLSIVIPIYNVESYLRQCLDSIVNQTYSDIEIILVDDGSPDNCGRICDEYAAKDDRIVVIHKENGGLCSARNAGLNAATGKWVAFVDSDDWCDTDYYEHIMFEINKKNDRIDVFSANGAIAERGGQSRTRYTFKSAYEYTTKDEMEKLMEMVLLGCGKDTVTMGVLWDKVFNAGFLKDNNITFDPSCKAWEDLWFCFQVFDIAKTVEGKTMLGYHYRWVANSITKGYNPNKLLIGYDFLTKIDRYIQACGMGGRMAHAFSVRAFEVIINSFNAYYFHPSGTLPKEELSEKIKEIKNMPYFQQAIYSNNNRNLPYKWVIVKYLLRLPWSWQLRLCYRLKNDLKMRR